MTRYNIYQNNTKIKDNATAIQVEAITGLTLNRIALYVHSGKVYHGKKGEFTFDYPDNELEKRADPVFEEQWDRARFKLNPGARMKL